MKACNTCGNPLDHSNNRSAQCLPCRRISDKAWRANKKAEGIPFAVTLMPKEYYREYNKRRIFTDEDRKVIAARAKRIRSDPKSAYKVLAREKTRGAIRRGELIPMACEVCGETKSEAHHDDYSKPLDVRWLCRIHHAEFHIQAKKQTQAEGGV